MDGSAYPALALSWRGVGFFAVASMLLYATICERGILPLNMATSLRRGTLLKSDYMHHLESHQDNGKMGNSVELRMRKPLAVYFSGRMAGYRLTSEHLKTFWKTNLFDVFVCINARSSRNYEQDIKNVLGVSHIAFTCSPPSPLHWRSYNRRNETVLDTAFSMFFQNKICFDQIDTFAEMRGEEYVAVMKYRADVVSSDVISTDDILSRKNNTIYVPTRYQYLGVNDQIAYGSMDAMRFYSSTFQILDELIRNGTLINPEILLKESLKFYNLSLQLIDFDYSLHPSRFQKQNLTSCFGQT